MLAAIYAVAILGAATIATQSTTVVCQNADLLGNTMAGYPLNMGYTDCMAACTSTTGCIGTLLVASNTTGSSCYLKADGNYGGLAHSCESTVCSAFGVKGCLVSLLPNVTTTLAQYTPDRPVYCF